MFQTGDRTPRQKVQVAFGISEDRDSDRGKTLKHTLEILGLGPSRQRVTRLRPV